MKYIKNLLFYLGEVLEALLELECLDILEDTKPKVDVYIKKKEAGDLVAMSNFANCENFFSIIKTLAVALGNQDPCRDVHKYANGLKNKKHEVSTYLLQLNEYETAPYFIQFSQNLTWDCLLIFVFCPEFTSAEPRIVLNIISEQF